MNNGLKLESLTRKKPGIITAANSEIVMIVNVITIIELASIPMYVITLRKIINPRVRIIFIFPGTCSGRRYATAPTIASVVASVPIRKPVQPTRKDINRPYVCLANS